MNDPSRLRTAATTVLLVPVLLTAACMNKVTAGSADSAPGIVDVAPPEYRGQSGDPLEEACRNWRLSPAQVAAFFHLAETYAETPYGRFHQIDCSISGTLVADGRRWRFAINGGGIATWRDGDTTRHFGCSAPECDPLLLLPSDGMQPD